MLPKSTLPFFALILSASGSPLFRRDDSGLTPADQNTILNYHNTVRQRFGSAPLVWNPTLATSARGYAGKCIWWTHADPGNYGENIAGADPNPYPYDLTRLVPGWAAEESAYDWSKPGFAWATGHFTQVVWKETTSVGCGIQYCSGRYSPATFPATGNGPVWDGNNDKGWLLVCRYSSPGNYGYTQDYIRNVPCPSDKPNAPGCSGNSASGAGAGASNSGQTQSGGGGAPTQNQPSSGQMQTQSQMNTSGQTQSGGGSPTQNQSPSPSQGSGGGAGSQNVPQYCLDWAKTQPTYAGFHVTGTTDANGYTQCSYAADPITPGPNGSPGVPQYCLDWAKTQPTYTGYHVVGTTTNGNTQCSYAPDS